MGGIETRRRPGGRMHLPEVREDGSAPGRGPLLSDELPELRDKKWSGNKINMSLTEYPENAE